MADPPLRFGAPEPGLHYRERPAAYGLLEREGRRRLAEACFAFLPARAELDLAGKTCPGSMTGCSALRLGSERLDAGAEGRPAAGAEFS